MSTDCTHKKLKYSVEVGKWVCQRCDAEVANENDGCKEICETGQLPQMAPVAEGYFSYSLNQYVSNRHDYNEKLDAINDPERNPDHPHNETPAERDAYVRECQEQGIVP
jgi:hypothetical protein